MSHLREAASATDWHEACALLQQVYVQGGYTTAELAAAFMTRERLADEGAFLIAVNEVVGGQSSFASIGLKARVSRERRRTCAMKTWPRERA